MSEHDNEVLLFLLATYGYSTQRGYGVYSQMTLQSIPDTSQVQTDPPGDPALPGMLWRYKRQG